MPKNMELMKLIATDGEHHPMGPSGADRWMVCPASVGDTIHMVDEGSDAAREGTIAHTLGELALSEGKDCDDFEGYTDEMRFYTQKYVDYVRSWAGTNKIYVEQRLDLNTYIPYGKGTSDAIIIDAAERTLHVMDLKYGKGVEVYAENNRQGMIYALGAYDKVSKHYEIDHIVIHIIQPRLGSFSEWSISTEKLLAFGEQVKVAADRCLEIDPEYHPDDKACMWCKAKATCPALYEHSLAVIGEDFDPLPPTQMTDEQLRLVIDNKGLIEKWLKAVESHVFERLEHGGSFNGYKMVEGRSQRKWVDGAETKLEQMLGPDAFNTKLKNITDIEKLLGKKHFNELGLTLKPEGKPVLVREDDKRPALGTIADDFEAM